MTAGDLLTAALQRLGVVGADRVASAEDLELGRLRFNDLIDSWATERLSIFTITRTTFPLTNGVQTYTVGTGATINIPRPMFIDSVGLVDPSVTPVLEWAITGPISEDEYRAIPQKTMSGTFPTRAYYNPTFGATGFGTLTVYPMPNNSAYQGVIYVPTAISEVAAVTTAIYLPPGYRRALRDGLAIEMAPDFDAEVTPSLLQAATEGKANVQRLNRRDRDLATPGLFTSSGWYDIWSDT